MGTLWAFYQTPYGHSPSKGWRAQRRCGGAPSGVGVAVGDGGVEEAVGDGVVKCGVGLRRRAVRVGRRRRALADSVERASVVHWRWSALVPYITHASLPVRTTNRQ